RLRGRRTARGRVGRPVRRRAVRPGGRLARRTERRRRRRSGVPRPPSVLGAVPPRGGGRPARRRLPVRPLRGPDGRPHRAGHGHRPSHRHRRRRPLMPRRTDLSSILVIGSGPIVIGQAAEFDYSGTQACRVLREEGFRVVLVNSNPATIMTDPEYAERTYVEPLLPGPVAQIIAEERPDALLPTLGGQTALNPAKALHEDGTLAKYGVELIGANYDAINCAEDRDL